MYSNELERAITTSYTRRQINQDRMIFGDFFVNFAPILLKFL